MKKIPYGITEARSQWDMVFEDFVTQGAGMKRESVVYILFIKLDTNSAILMMMEVVTEIFSHGGM